MVFGTICHEGHPDHKLVLINELRLFECDGCMEPGFGIRYACEKGCHFDLHKNCASPPDTVTHPFFPGCVFHFVVSGEQPNRHCNACGGDIKGSVYRCFDQGFDLHVSCANLSFELEGGFRLHEKLSVSVKCDKCGLKKPRNGFNSWLYVNKKKKCHLHVACVKEIQEENLERIYLGGGDGGESPGGVEAQINQGLVSSTPNLRIVVENGRKRTGKFKNFLQIFKIGIVVVLSAVLPGNSAAVAADLLDIIST